MKNTPFTTLLFSLLFLLSACGDEVSKELEQYVNEDIKSLSSVELEALEMYQSVTGANYTDDLTTFETMNELVPMYNEFITDVEAIRPKSKEIREVHDIYIEAVNTQQKAFVGILDAIQNQDYQGVQLANEQLADARKLFRDYQDALSDLLAEHDMELK
ncbi:hypothetical protein [Bacillus sp. EB01]|uniref:hypothetical protein n=1 Tax=Bacillus sp. EB01 TaxID=1347086 RepID=UPI0005C5350A|nr:hypothetical protein [Bacillus sp. EB01]